MSLSQAKPRTPSSQEPRETVPDAIKTARPVAVKTAIIGALLWMVAGPMTLFLSAIALVVKAKGFWTVADAFYGVGLAAMFAGRWIEYRSGVAENHDGAPISASDLRRYYFLLGVGGVALWAIASMIRTFWLTR